MASIPPLVLGIETSCDDTACALVDGSGTVLASVVSSQLAAHRPYGGVVPEVASREHLRNWPTVSAEALAAARIDLAAVDVVAATRGPGLVGALLVGLSLGKAIAFALNRPFHAVHHLEGHLYSPFLAAPGEPASAVPERFVALVVSGGHSSLFGVDGARVETLAETRDDAMGEVFDKVGKRIGLAYPQGPKVDALAETGNAGGWPFALARMSDRGLDFSFSGLKSQAILELEKLGIDALAPAQADDDDAVPQVVRDLLAGFRAAAVAQVVERLDRLHAARGFSCLAVSGGVAANRLLRRALVAWGEQRGVDVRLVPLRYAGDNAAMIAYAALLRHRLGLADDPRTAEAASRIPL